MGRPLKIAKAQAVVTITDTTTGTNLVTTNANFTNLGIIAGMPFIPASNIGNLVAGTTYWILSVVNAGPNSEFTVSETQLSANPTYTEFALATDSGTVAATVGVVDAYFNNPIGGAGYPATNANTYGVVGGNTAIYGSQVLSNVAIGQNGTGTLYSATDTAYVTGIGTDLANALSVGSVIQVASANINGTTTDYTTLGFANTVPGLTTVAVANTQNTGNIIGTSGNAQTLLANGTVRFTANLGGLVSGQIYFVKAIANASAFTVSTTLGGAEVDLSSATGTPDAQQDVVELVANAAAAASGSSFIYATPEAGFIVRQKGKTKYLVTGATTGLTAQCSTANVANTALSPNTMTITATYANTATSKVSSLNDYNSEVFPAQVAASSLVQGTVYTIYNAGNTDWTAVGAFANMTGITFVATGAGSGTGTAVLADVNPDVIASFNSAIAANANASLPPVVTITNA
jgi:hypothetical protein